MATKKRYIDAIFAEKLFIAAYVLLVVITIAAFFFGRQFLENKHNNLLKAREAVAKNDSRIENTRKSKDWLESSENSPLVEKINEAILTADNYQIKTYNDLFSYANIAGIGIKGVTFPTIDAAASATASPAPTTGAPATTSDGSAAPAGTTPVSISLTLEGVRYINFIAFLKLLENSPTPYIVNDISISEDGEGSDKLNLPTMIITTYIRK